MTYGITSYIKYILRRGRDVCDARGECARGEAERAEEVAERDPPGGIVEEPAPPEPPREDLVPSRRVVVGVVVWARAEDDRDLGPRIEGVDPVGGGRRRERGVAMEGMRHASRRVSSSSSSEQGMARRRGLVASSPTMNVHAASRGRYLAVVVAVGRSARRPEVAAVLARWDEETSQQRRGLAPRGALRQRLAAIVVHVPEHRRSGSVFDDYRVARRSGARDG